MENPEQNKRELLLSFPNNYGLKHTKTEQGDEFVSILENGKVLVKLDRQTAKMMFEYALFVLKVNR